VCLSDNVCGCQCVCVYVPAPVSMSVSVPAPVPVPVCACACVCVCFCLCAFDCVPLCLFVSVRVSVCLGLCVCGYGCRALNHTVSMLSSRSQQETTHTETKHELSRAAAPSFWKILKMVQMSCGGKLTLKRNSAEKNGP